MNPRLALYQLQARHGIAGADVEALTRLASLEDEPAQAADLLQRGLAVLAAALLGLGLILWVAANWASLSRGLRFGMLEGLIALMVLASLLRPALRAPLLLLAFLAQGGALAFFGQTYQTGADPWQLFALWAALSLPFALAARSEVLWAPWALVAMSAIALWYSSGIQFWHFDPSDLAHRLTAWALAIALTVWLAPLSRWQALLGCGAWSFRLAVLLACVLVGGSALDGLFFAGHTHPIYWLGLGVFALGVGALLFRGRDVFALSALALAIDTLLICGLVRLLLENQRGDPIGLFLLIGLVAAALVGFSVSAVLRVWRADQREQEGV